MNGEIYAVSTAGFRRINAGAELQDGEVAANVVPPEVLRAIRVAQGRAMRSALLRGSDWTQGSDAQLPSSVKLAYAEWRQKLRDLPGEMDFPDCMWPAAPDLPESAADLGATVPTDV